MTATSLASRTVASISGEKPSRKSLVLWLLLLLLLLLLLVLQCMW
jgi:hypothetical protein